VAACMAAGLLATHRATAQSGEPGPVLRGRIIDARTAMPLRDVTVVLTSGSDTLGRTRSDSTGIFQSSIVGVSPIVVHFARIGYRADSLVSSANAEFPLRVAMAPVGGIANTLAALVVRDTARSSFERRARRGSGGTFIRAADIEKRKPLRTSDLFRSLPGVGIEDSSGVTQLVSLRAARQTPPTARKFELGGVGASMPSTNARSCVLRVGLNGRLMEIGFSVDDIRPQEILGIEAYLGAATIPTEFSSVQHDAPCGIIMIWAKTGGER
jgi:hypothetical protein